MYGQLGVGALWGHVALHPPFQHLYKVALVVKHPPAYSGELRDTTSFSGTGRSPRGGHSNPLQYSCLENPMDRGGWRAAVHRVAKSWTRLKRLSMHACTEP